MANYFLFRCFAHLLISIARVFPFFKALCIAVAFKVIIGFILFSFAFTATAQVQKHDFHVPPVTEQEHLIDSMDVKRLNVHLHTYAKKPYGERHTVSQVFLETFENIATYDDTRRLFRDSKWDYKKKATFDFDKKGKLLAEIDYDEDQDVVYTEHRDYNTAGELVHFISHNGEGRLISHISYEFNKHGKLHSQRYLIGDNTKQKEVYTYNEQDSVIQVDYYLRHGENHQKALLSYPDQNTKKKVLYDDDDNKLEEQIWQYNPNGRLKKVDYYDFVEEKGYNKTFDYYADGREKQIVQTKENGDTIAATFYDYRDEGRELEITHREPTASLENYRETVLFDRKGRVVMMMIKTPFPGKNNQEMPVLEKHIYEYEGDSPLPVAVVSMEKYDSEVLFTQKIYDYEYYPEF